VASCRTAAELRRCLAEAISAMLAGRMSDLEGDALVSKANRALDGWERRGRAGGS
jgi:hypothetical protein